jgi:flagella basal body P-ring formation protein FlgA
MASEGKVMFSIYKDTTYNNDFHVVYFTELNEHNKDDEINKAMNGESLFDGYLREATKVEAKVLIAQALRKLNAGDELTADDLKETLATHLA